MIHANNSKLDQESVDTAKSAGRRYVKYGLQGVPVKLRREYCIGMIRNSTKLGMWYMAAKYAFALAYVNSH